MVAWLHERGAKEGAEVQLISADNEFWRVIKVYRPGLPDEALCTKQNLDRGSLSSLVDA